MALEVGNIENYIKSKHEHLISACDMKKKNVSSKFKILQWLFKHWVLFRLYQDMLEKPSELLLHRPVEEDGLGLHHLQSKALASLITTFLQTSANPSFQQSLYHSLLYRHHCLQDNSVPDIELPPYYSQHFFNTIREVIECSPLNTVRMSVKDWYRYL